MNTPRQNKGCFITIDGPNGVGKSTIISHLKARLWAKGIQPILTAEPTKSALGLLIREHQEHYRGRTLACLVAADRYEHIEREIKPALGKGQLVISDRYVLSSLVYQILDGVSPGFVLALNKDIVIPQLSILLTASADTLSERLAARSNLTRFEREHHMREGFLYEQALTTIEEMGFNCLRIENDQMSPVQCSERLEEVLLQTIEATS